MTEINKIIHYQKAASSLDKYAVGSCCKKKTYIDFRKKLYLIKSEKFEYIGSIDENVPFVYTSVFWVRRNLNTAGWFMGSSTSKNNLFWIEYSLFLSQKTQIFIKESLCNAL